MFKLRLSRRFLTSRRRGITGAALLAASLIGISTLTLAWDNTVEATQGGPPAAEASRALTTATQQVQARDFSYSPASFSTPAGEALTVTVTNAGPSPHTFTISGVTDTGSIAPGATRTAQFTPSQAGTLRFFCTIHGQDVMSGVITVQAAAAPAQPAQPPATAPQTAPQPQGPATQPQQPAMRPPSTGDGGLLTLLPLAPSD